MATEPRVQIEIPVADLLEPFLDRHRYVRGGKGEFALLSEVVKKTTDRALLMRMAKVVMVRLVEIYDTDANRYDQLSITETFNLTGTQEHTVRGYNTRAENSRKRAKAYKVLERLLSMVKNKQNLDKIVSINFVKL